MKAQNIHGRTARENAPRHFEKAFTLIELLIVMVIIGVLSVLIFSGVNHAREAARSATCMSNLKQLGGALLLYAAENQNKLIPLQPATNPDTGKRPPIWTVQLARAGYLTSWNGQGDAPCGTGVWACPSCAFTSYTHGGYGVVEGAIFVYEENKPTGVSDTGSLRLSRIADPANTWLVGDAYQKSDEPNKSWYAIWSKPERWTEHGPAARHNGKVNVCMVDGHVESLTIEEIKKRQLTENVLVERTY